MARKDAIRALNQATPEHPRHLCSCSYQGLHCQYFWVVSDFTNGTPGVCNQHAGMKFGERYKEIIEESHEWARRRSLQRVA